MKKNEQKAEIATLLDHHIDNDVPWAAIRMLPHKPVVDNVMSVPNYYLRFLTEGGYPMLQPFRINIDAEELKKVDTMFAVTNMGRHAWLALTNFYNEKKIYPILPETLNGDNGKSMHEYALRKLGIAMLEAAHGYQADRFGPDFAELTSVGNGEHELHLLFHGLHFRIGDVSGMYNDYNNKDTGIHGVATLLHRQYNFVIRRVEKTIDASYDLSNYAIDPDYLTGRIYNELDKHMPWLRLNSWFNIERISLTAYEKKQIKL